MRFTPEILAEFDRHNRGIRKAAAADYDRGYCNEPTCHNQAWGHGKCTTHRPRRVQPSSPAPARTRRSTREPHREAPPARLSTGRAVGALSPASGRPRLEPSMTTAHIDGCPACVVNSEPPARIEAIPGGSREHYRCTDCGHEWYTSWMEG